MISCKINNWCVLGPRREIERIFGFMRGIPSLTRQEYSGDQEIRRSGGIPVRSQEEFPLFKERGSIDWIIMIRRHLTRIYSITGWCDIPSKASDLMNKPRRRTGQSSQNYFLSFSNGTYKPCLVLFISCYFVMSSCNVIIVTEYLTEIHIQKVNQCHVDQCH